MPPDRLPTYRIVFGSDVNPKTPKLHAGLQLYIPGKNRVDEFRKYAVKKLTSNYPDVPALWQLAQRLLNCLKIVWIPLDPVNTIEHTLPQTLDEAWKIYLDKEAEDEQSFRAYSFARESLSSQRACQ